MKIDDFLLPLGQRGSVLGKGGLFWGCWWRELKFGEDYNEL